MFRGKDTIGRVGREQEQLAFAEGCRNERTFIRVKAVMDSHMTCHQAMLLFVLELVISRTHLSMT